MHAPRPISVFTVKKNANHHCSLCPKLFAQNNQSNQSNQRVMPRQTSAIAVTEETMPDQIAAVASSGHYTMMQTTTTTIRNPVKPHLNQKLRILFDSGSSRTFISNSLTHRLQLQSSKAETFNMATFGNQTEMTAECPRTEIELKLLDGSFRRISTSVWPSDHLTKPMKRHQLKEEAIIEIQQYRLADKIPKQTEKSDIDMVIGNDFINDFMLSGRIPVQSAEGLILLQSLFGWILTGRINTEDSEVNCNEPISCLNFLVIQYGKDIKEQSMLFSGPESSKFLNEPKQSPQENDINFMTSAIQTNDKRELNNSVWGPLCCSRNDWNQRLNN